MRSKGKTALVTGTAVGIGRTTAVALASYISGQNIQIDGSRRRI